MNKRGHLFIMKRKLLYLLVAVLAVAVCFAACGKEPEPEEDESLIKSENIVSFSCDFVTDQIAGSRVEYKFSAELDASGEKVKCQYFADDSTPFEARQFDFVTDRSILEAIQTVVKDNALEQFMNVMNRDTTISEYTGASLKAVYDSQEKLEFFDNKNNLLPADAMKALEKIFYDASGASSFDSKDQLNSLYYIIYSDEGEYRYFLSMFRRLDGSVSIYIVDKRKEDNFRSVNRDVSPELMDEIDQICRENLIVKDPESSETTSKYPIEIGMRYGNNETVISTAEGTTRAELKALESIVDKVNSHMKLIESNWA